MDQQAKEWGHIGECGPLPAGTVPSDGAPSMYSEYSTILIGRRPRKRTNKTMKKRENDFKSHRKLEKKLEKNWKKTRFSSKVSTKTDGI